MTEKKTSEILPLRIFLEGEICDKMASEFIQLIYQRGHLHKEIEIFINSHGGSVYAGMALTDFIIHLHNTHKVSTIAMSMVMSCAINVYMSGEHRYAFKTVRFMQHSPMLSVQQCTSRQLKYYSTELDADMEWGLKYSTRDSLLTPMQLLAYIESSEEGDFFYNYEFAKEHLIINRDGLPPPTKAKCFVINPPEEE